MMNKFCDFTNAKVGDEVWHFRWGWMRITLVDLEAEYPIVINGGTYLLDGRVSESDEFPAIFWNKFEVPECAFIKPLPKLEVDTPVWVWDRDRKYRKLQAFSHFDEYGDIMCFTEGFSSDNYKALTSWDNWELVK